MNDKGGQLFLIPTFLGDNASVCTLSESIINVVLKVNHYIVENEKSARRFIKRICPNKRQSDIFIQKLNKYTPAEDYQNYLNPIIKQNCSIGILSEAGCPSVADPGSIVVKMAHAQDIKVMPLVGPSSILLSLMASGMNGQSFQFHGYLPIDKKMKIKKIIDLEKLALTNNQTQIFIETPYRNQKILEDLIKTLNNNTMLCLCTDLTLPDETIISKTVKYWKTHTYNVYKKPTIFLIGN